MRTGYYPAAECPADAPMPGSDPDEAPARQVADPGSAAAYPRQAWRQPAGLPVLAGSVQQGADPASGQAERYWSRGRPAWLPGQDADPGWALRHRDAGPQLAGAGPVWVRPAGPRAAPPAHLPLPLGHRGRWEPRELLALLAHRAWGPRALTWGQLRRRALPHPQVWPLPVRFESFR